MTAMLDRSLLPTKTASPPKLTLLYRTHNIFIQTMQLTKTKEHICKFWSYNLKHHYRHCKYCGKTQYNYSGEWEDKISFEQFVSKWVCGMGNGELDIRIDVAHPFEAYTYENWNRVIYVEFLSGEYAGQRFGYFANWNMADAALRKKGLEHYSVRGKTAIPTTPMSNSDNK